MNFFWKINFLIRVKHCVLFPWLFQFWQPSIQKGCKNFIKCILKTDFWSIWCLCKSCSYCSELFRKKNPPKNYSWAIHKKISIAQKTSLKNHILWLCFTWQKSYPLSYATKKSTFIWQWCQISIFDHINC